MRRYLAVSLFLLLVCALPGQAQYTSYALIGSDGNLYGSSGPDFYSYSPTSGALTTLNSVGLVLCAERSDGTLLGYNYSSNNTVLAVRHRREAYR
jgi:hypothetical protein